MQSKTAPKKSFILILYGYPGSGKSTFARQLAGEVKNTVHLNLDKVQVELGEELKNKNVSDGAILGILVEYMVKEFIRNGLNVILDVPTAKKSERRKLANLARTANAKLVMAWLQIDANSAYERLRKRDKRKIDDRYARTYSRSEFESAINYSQNPSEENYVVISGKHTFNTQKLAVLKKLTELGVITSEEAVNKRIKPELVNLIPQSFRSQGNIKRRDISIR